MRLVATGGDALTVEPHRPLYERAPTRDEYGRPVGDFMMLIPGLRDRPRHQLAATLARINAVLTQFHEVVFADLNVRLNLLWVSVRARPGVILEVSGALKRHIPEALLVAEHRSR
ncbi:MAG TPA: hypothetical protein VGA00_09050 [Acidiferrobacterales bacterium]|jgi:hypothetical protein